MGPLRALPAVFVVTGALLAPAAGEEPAKPKPAPREAIEALETRLARAADQAACPTPRSSSGAPSPRAGTAKLAEITGISLNTVRRTLYLLYEHRLAKYKRKRDPDSGWLTYLWQICPENFDKALESEAKRLVRKLEERLAHEKNNIFYACSEGCARSVFDERQ